MSAAVELTELLSAICDFLEVPEADEYDKSIRLRSNRAIVVSTLLDLLLKDRFSAADAVESLARAAGDYVAVDYPVAEAKASTR